MEFVKKDRTIPEIVADIKSTLKNYFSFVRYADENTELFENPRIWSAYKHIIITPLGGVNGTTDLAEMKTYDKKSCTELIEVISSLENIDQAGAEDLCFKDGEAHSFSNMLKNFRSTVQRKFLA